jgi:hypothetical protein
MRRRSIFNFWTFPDGQILDQTLLCLLSYVEQTRGEHVRGHGTRGAVDMNALSEIGAENLGVGHVPSRTTELAHGS